MLLAQLCGETVRVAGSQDGKPRQWLSQPIDRKCGDPLAKGGGVDGILDLFRNFASRYQDPRFEIGLSFDGLKDLAPNLALIEPRRAPVSACLEYEVSGAGSTAVASSLVARASTAERNVEQFAERRLCKALQAAGLGAKQDGLKLIARIWYAIALVSTGRHESFFAE